MTFKELITNDVRNREIVQDIVKAYQDGRFCLVITERKEHLESLKVVLSGGERLARICGNIKTKECQKELERFKNFRREEGGACCSKQGNWLAKVLIIRNWIRYFLQCQYPTGLYLFNMWVVCSDCVTKSTKCALLITGIHKKDVWKRCLLNG